MAGSTPYLDPSWVQSVLDGSDVGAFEIGADHRFRFVSSRCAEMLGRGVPALMALPSVLDVVASGDRATVEAHLSTRLARSGRLRGTTFRVRLPDGGLTTVEARAVRLRRGHDPVVAGLLLDASKRTRLQDRLRRARRLEALGELTGAVAHDFNNLLTAIVGPVDLALADLASDHPAASRLAEARRTALRARALTRQLLHQRRGTPDRSHPVRPGDLLLDMRGLLEQLGGDGVEVRLAVDPGAPWVRIDPTRFEQVVANLVVNARDAMGRRGTVDVAVGRVEWRDRPSVRLTVQDEGPGIPDAARSRVFEPGFTTREDGTGLGLSTVKTIVEGAGGEIRVEGGRGSGARLAVTLPGVEAPLPDAAPAKETVTARARGGDRPRILIVDGDADVRRVAAAALSRFGYDVLTAPGEDEATELARREGDRIDLLLADADLRSRSSPDAVQSILSHCTDAGVVLTGDPRPEGGTTQPRPDAAVWLEKPFSLHDLLTAVRTALAPTDPGFNRISDIS